MIWNGNSVGMTTLVAYFDHKPDEFIPTGSGNCFSLWSSFFGIKKDFQIVNIGLEDLKKWMKLTNTSFPIKIKPISKSHAVIVDERVPKDWLWDEYCTICCPNNLLPKKQRDEIEARIKDKISKGLIQWVLPAHLEDKLTEEQKVNIRFRPDLKTEGYMIEKAYPDNMPNQIVFGVETEITSEIEYPEFYKKKDLENN